MRRLARPDDLPNDVFLKCLSVIRSRALKNRLTLCEQNIIEASREFEEKVQTMSLHTIERLSDLPGGVTPEEMIAVYTSRMAAKGAPGRSFYDKIMASPRQGRCPLCNQRIVTTLDHHLPKAYYPILSVVPLNLIPACIDCNKIKTQSFPTRSEEETIHPYFDNVEDDVWLTASVVEEGPPSLVFSVTPPEIWNRLLSERVRFHFNIYKLNILYASHAAEELTNIKHSLNELFTTGGRDSVRSYLEEAATSRIRAYQNSWQAATYLAISNNDWYCNGGFNLL